MSIIRGSTVTCSDTSIISSTCVHNTMLLIALCIVLGRRCSPGSSLRWLHGGRHAQNSQVRRDIFIPCLQEEPQGKGKPIYTSATTTPGTFVSSLPLSFPQIISCILHYYSSLYIYTTFHYYFSFSPILTLSFLSSLSPSLYSPLPLQLRLLYECCPMAYIIEQAGGKASSGVKPILDIQPTNIHQRAPIFIGSVENVDDYMKIRAECNKAEKK